MKKSQIIFLIFIWALFGFIIYIQSLDGEGWLRKAPNLLIMLGYFFLTLQCTIGTVEEIRRQKERPLGYRYSNIMFVCVLIILCTNLLLIIFENISLCQHIIVLIATVYVVLLVRWLIRARNCLKEAREDVKKHYQGRIIHKVIGLVIGSVNFIIVFTILQLVSTGALSLK